MTNRRFVLAFMATALCSFTTSAAESYVRGRFVREDPVTHQRIPVSEATFADKIFFQFVVALPPGDHPLQLNIYDGQGREVLDAEATLTSRNGEAGRSVSYGFVEARDAPGTWWYVMAINGKVVGSKSLEVRAL